ncbi:unnamed protein product (macronuclear) [Paramecium tetraurelia]|uniref:Cyclic nucleotide-binding domain-containing protein n=1 Tax=Paramecium tetraurelia TaxID=5888 RepID=A0EI55_PARTE|nr:uncharacterized protein GSPATT00027323001 [Paramecium tetraurelia]CAK94996.1 unnamed protein product [Paramecium tetraurelia]|eukprot:XP_001462369.1 hypothetical protein (macronuclear) [Paramecium tetraurelia strain d4-2]
MRRLIFNAEQVRRASTVLQKFDFRQSLTGSNNKDLIDVIVYVLQKPCEMRTSTDVFMLRSATRSIEFFNNLESDLLHEQCCKSLQYKYLQAGHFIFKEGDIGDKFYIIISGRVQVLKDFNPNDLQASIYDHEIKQLSNGDTFGERGMDVEAIRTASCRTLENTHLAYLERESFLTILNNVKHLMKKTYFEEFANLDLFHNWKFQDIKAFYDKVFIKKYSMNACVYKEGGSLDYVYIIKKGEFKIVKTVLTSTIDLNEMFMGDFEKILLGMNHKQKTLSEIIEARYQKKKFGNNYYKQMKKLVTIKYITSGQMFGEMELLMQNQITRTHSVYSNTDQSELYQLKVEHFEAILDRIPQIKQQLISLSEQKNKYFMKQLLSYEKNFNDLTEVKKEIEKNINLDFLEIGTREKPKPTKPIQHLDTEFSTTRKQKFIKTQIEMQQQQQSKKKFLIKKQYQNSYFFNSLSSRMRTDDNEEEDIKYDYNFVHLSCK